MIDKERLILSSIIGAQLGPVLDRLAVPTADQPYVIGWIVAAIPIAYHLITQYGPRMMARWFPAISPQGSANPTPLQIPVESGVSPRPFSLPQPKE